MSVRVYWGHSMTCWGLLLLGPAGVSWHLLVYWGLTGTWWVLVGLTGVCRALPGSPADGTEWSLMVCGGSPQFPLPHSPPRLVCTGLYWSALVCAVPGVAQGAVGQGQGRGGPQPQGLADGGLQEGQAPRVPQPRGSLCSLQLCPQPSLQLHRGSTGVPHLSGGSGQGGHSRGHTDPPQLKPAPGTPNHP